MNKQHKTLFFMSVALFVIIATVLFLLLVPNMSSPLINTIPEYPPELGSSENSYTETGEIVSVDRTNVKNIVAAISRPNEYFSETKSVLFYNGGNSEFSRKKWIKGELARVDVISPNGQTSLTHYVYTKDSVFVWRTGSRTYYKGALGSFEPDDAQMMMSYEDILSASDDSIITAQLTTHDGISCIYAEIKDPYTGYTEEYWISYTTGLLVYGKTLDEAGNTIYTINSAHTDISAQSLETFRLPNGDLPTEQNG